MLLLISPSKTQTFDGQPYKKFTQPEFGKEIQTLVNHLKSIDKKGLSSLMNLSEKLADLNWHRFQNFYSYFDLDNSRQAILTFKGDVYAGLKAEEFSTDDLHFTQSHLRILSGLYGLLKPLDLIQPYRLEMKTKLKTELANNLYGFWGNKITDSLNHDLESADHSYLVNLASQEYVKSIQLAQLRKPVLEITFKTRKNDHYKVIAIHAKRARGLMANFVVQNRLTDINHLKSFKMDGYNYNASLSRELKWTFCKD
jgi:uncharacterized protein